MTARTRSRVQYQPNGRQRLAGHTGWTYNADTLAYSESCDDYTHEGSGRPLSIVRRKRTGGIVTKMGTGFYTTEVDSVRASYFTSGNNGHAGSFPTSEVPNLVALTAAAAARTNPSRPLVDLPVAIAELRDLPRMFKNHGDYLLSQKMLKRIKREKGKDVPKRAADAYLNYQFGWAPLISDIGKLLEFTAHFDRRMKELNKLYDQGLRKKVRLNEFEKRTISSNNTTVHSLGVTITKQLVDTHREEAWGFCEWSPTSKYSKPDEYRMRRLAWRAMLGLTVDLKTFWELMPWSWMIDYSSTIGDYLMAQRNVVPARLKQVLIMRHRTSTRSCTSSKFNGGGMTAYEGVLETKTRELGILLPVAHLPILSNRQLSILGSIAFLRK